MFDICIPLQRRNMKTMANTRYEIGKKYKQILLLDILVKALCAISIFFIWPDKYVGHMPLRLGRNTNTAGS